MSDSISSSPIAFRPAQAEHRLTPPLEVGGFTPLSTTDWPGQLAAVVFLSLIHI